MRQYQRILEYMKNHGSITSLEAFRHLGCTRLSAQIFDLKRKGYNIKSERVTVPTRDGTANVARYTLEE